MGDQILSKSLMKPVDINPNHEWTNIGDETFITAALMVMRHPKSIVLSRAFTALIVMTVLSTGLGRILPNLISRKYTNSAATVLYAFFGMRPLYIAWRSKDSKASQKKEMEEPGQAVMNKAHGAADTVKDGTGMKK